MTWYRTIKWLTILMLALSLAMTGAWVWAAQQSESSLFSWSGGFSVPFYQYNDALLPESEIAELPDLHLIPVVGTVRVKYDIRVQGRMKFLRPGVPLLATQYEEEVSYSEWYPRKLQHYHEIERVLTPTNEQISTFAVETFSRQQADPSLIVQSQSVIDALKRGPGTRTRIWWPGVAQRVRIHAPRALALTGFLTLAGLTTLFIQRRRDRVKSGYCAACGYDLRGLTAAVCPECGQDAPSPAPGGRGVAEGGHSVTEGADSK